MTALEASHRVFDALFLACTINENDEQVPFRPRKRGQTGASVHGRRLEQVSAANATALFEICPTALVFGAWDSHGARGGLGGQIPAIRSEPLRRKASRSSCTRVGLREPSDVALAGAPFLPGVEHAREFPLFRATPDAPRRRHVHVRLEFDELVHGPVVIGAARYLGYGLCRPMPYGE